MAKRASVGGPRAARAVRVVLSSAPPRVARRIADRLVERGLAACVHVLPGASSVYRWRGKVERARESTLVIKVAARGLPRLLAALDDEHPYEVPEAVVLCPAGGLKAYLTWVASSGERSTP